MSLLVRAQQSIIDREALKAIREAEAWPGLFQQSFEQIKRGLEAEMAGEMDVPQPKDLAGGYSHEKHKSNFFMMQKAGDLYLLTGDERYAAYIKKLLFQYREIYPSLTKHPATRSYARGKFFWQCLNDANWLVYSSQAYAAIYDYLSEAEQEDLNQNLFRPYAEYISIENPQFFNRIHNHSTWGNAAVGMVALVLNDDELLNWALYGLQSVSIDGDEVDNDGGYIYQKNQVKTGFLAQIDHSFSPEGYYTEGPYYQRYALYPFLVFAKALALAKPELKILEYRDGVLGKAVRCIIELSDGRGQFFPINDAQKGMSLKARELILGLSFLYNQYGTDKSLLSLIEEQGQVPINADGYQAAFGIANNQAKIYRKRSHSFGDGAEGNEGAITVLRSRKNPEQAVLLKYGKHGMGHGHFDRLGILIQDGDYECIQDYGAARWVNIEHKDGGGYLKENNSWAKQTIAHNTLVLNKTSQFEGQVKKADPHHGIHLDFDTSAANYQIVRAAEKEAYPGLRLERSLVLLDLEELDEPLVLDLFRVQSSTGERQLMELPNYYQGELLKSNLSLSKKAKLEAMGLAHGYEHLWLEGAIANPEVENAMHQLTYFNGYRFYTISQALMPGDALNLARIGANDSLFNLRRDPVLIWERESEETLFVQVFEPHGYYLPEAEIPVNSHSRVKGLKVLSADSTRTVVELKLAKATYLFVLDFSGAESHELQQQGQKWSWSGDHTLIKLN